MLWLITVKLVKSNGKWSQNGKQECIEIKTCPLRVEIEGDGNVFCYGNRPGAKCDVQCPYGYVLVGDSQIQCGDDGEWKGTIKYTDRLY